MCTEGIGHPAALRICAYVPTVGVGGRRGAPGRGRRARGLKVSTAMVKHRLVWEDGEKVKVNMARRRHQHLSVFGTECSGVQGHHGPALSR